MMIEFKVHCYITPLSARIRHEFNVECRSQTGQVLHDSCGDKGVVVEPVDRHQVHQHRHHHSLVVPCSSQNKLECHADSGVHWWIQLSSGCQQEI